MKWNILIGTLVLGLGLSTQSFGFELLDRMLGVTTGGPGCCAVPACGCDAVVGHHAACPPTCGHAHGGLLGHHRAPACPPKCDAVCPPKCDAVCPPKCEVVPVCPQRHRRPLFGHRHHCAAPCPPKCDAAHPPHCHAAHAPKCHVGHAPKCHVGHAPKCDAVCPPACPPAHHCGPGLLERIFGPRHHCPAPCPPLCGCDGGYFNGSAQPTPVDDDDMAPMPPAPVVDPSAYLPSHRRVIQASTKVVR